ncbi:Protein CELLULOSE SYNTHASE INTERACTIVE 1 [Camellia lanceoleosa]|uniref:Protein CELLULOSE SYNTHASE INTERACTIVE 1 n=1 Tax=Camellia lanceoleosa TaxID=1840588 RepID=A0ACC0GJ45_9ERIC|nr:Protein CELLULOSE SYNTHASE INTERACTIVE 1 [Camellia lanceoleosa]
MDHKYFDGRVIFVELAKPGRNAFGVYPKTTGPPQEQNIANQDEERNENAKHHDSELPTAHSLIKMGSRECSNMEHPDGTLASVAQCIEQLGQNSSSVQEQE